MSLYYKDTITRVILGSKNPETKAITPIALTSSYGAGTAKVIETSGYSKMNLDFLYQLGTGETTNTLNVQIEGSPDGVNFYRIPNESTSGGTSTLSARELAFVGASDASPYTISFGLDIFYKYVKVSVKESGATVAGTIFAEATLLGL